MKFSRCIHAIMQASSRSCHHGSLSESMPTVLTDSKDQGLALIGVAKAEH